MSSTGAITGYIDVAQLVLYAFWIFFAGLVFYLRGEDKREGYPLESDRSVRAPRVKIQGFPPIPKPKVFALAGGATYTAPPGNGDSRPINAKPVAAWPGAPLYPTGNPLTDGVGPAAYADRKDEPDITIDGKPRVVPFSSAKEFSLVARDPDPRGMDIVGADQQLAGKVQDLWVDRVEPRILYLEVTTSDNGKHILCPMAFVRIDKKHNRISVRALLASQFKDAPAISSPNQVTKLEEDRINAYFAGGYLYATPARQEPWL